jgi:ATP-dependent exoDNAse (exonuclease V) beta subunit
MSKPTARPLPPDQAQREQALDPGRSILVQAPAGSGKTDLLTRRFLRLLGEVEEPGQIVAITFTKAAAAEMRHRILSELEKAATSDATTSDADEFSMDALARRALDRSSVLGWQLLDLPAQLRISTIDSFCRDLALQQPLLTELGGELGINEQPEELHRRAARRTLEKIGGVDAPLSSAIEKLLLWRDNEWQGMEDLLVVMLGQRDRWMHGFVLDRAPDWQALRERLERPFAQAVRDGLTGLSQHLDQVLGAREEALALARFASEQSGGTLHQGLAELAEFPAEPFTNSEALEEARHAYLDVGALLLTNDGAFRKQVNKTQGFPADRNAEKNRLLGLIQALGTIAGFEAALDAVRNLPPARYTDDDWQIVQACFTVLRQAAVELRVVFAEAGTVDFIEVAQIADRVLRDDDGLPTDAALAIADGIHHLLVDEFQDTSRRQHRLLASLVAAWPDQSGRTLFVVGDCMQSIYFFRDADAELFPRVQTIGLEIPDNEPLVFDFVPLRTNFRTEPELVEKLNDGFAKVFAQNDGSGVKFSPAEPAREPSTGSDPHLTLHLEFVPQTGRGKSLDPNAIRQKEEAAQEREAAHAAQTTKIVALIRSHMERVQQARACGAKYRIAVLGRARKSLAPIAQALREAAIPFRAVELEQLRDRPEVLDALALGRALLNPQDRVAWLGMLRAPWCGLALDDLHHLASADDVEMLARPLPELLSERQELLTEEGRRAVARVLNALESLTALRTAQPTASLGTWLEQVWLSLGGASCADATARANLDLLWSCLDSLPGGEQDLLGATLDTALEKLTALPDPAASSECGVQLMTIHKSKGLEFEVVIVPDLQARGGSSRSKLLSWLERGLAQPDGSGEITEFLVAPLQPRGADRGKAKEWVDRIYRERESQETRRILYVAATRAREELHLCARPDFKYENGELTLAEPGGSLLATAWPAFEEEIRARLQVWKAGLENAETEIADLAASAESNLLVMPSPVRPTLLRRLPADFQPAPLSGLGLPSTQQKQSPTGIGASRLYERHEGGLLSRALGSAVHKLLQDLASLRATHDWSAARAALSRLQPRIAAQIRAAGVNQSQAESIAAKAFNFALAASRDPHGQWILSPHTEAASEAAWGGIVAGSLRTVRVDRVFRAGAEPLSEGDDAWWIIDYKTAHDDGLDPSEALPGFRDLFAPQLEAYAAVLRNLHGTDLPIRAGLYYPRMALLDWWEVRQ